MDDSCFENLFACFSYNICIRQEAGYCCVQYQVCPDESSNDSFTLSAFKDTEAARIATQDSECTADYVTIAASSATCSRYYFSSLTMIENKEVQWRLGRPHSGKKKMGLIPTNF